MLKLKNHPFYVVAAVNLSVLNVHLETEPTTLDPALADDTYGLAILANTTDGLMGYDQNGKLEPRLSESIKIEHGTHYVFTLKKNARWSDGKAITSEDFVFGIKRTLDPKTGSKIASMLYAIKNAKAYNSGSKTEADVGVHAEKGKLIIDLERPTSYFLHCLTLVQTAPVRADVVAANPGKWLETSPVTGAYQITAHKREQEIKLEPNVNYWNYKKSALPVVLRIVPDESTAVSLFETGMLDVVNRLPPAQISRLREKGLVQDFSQAATFFLSFNVRKPVVSDKKIRRAISASIDRDGLTKALLTNDRPAYGWVPPMLEGGDSNPDLLKSFASSVEEVKSETSKHPTSIAASFNPTSFNVISMEKIQNDLQKKLGLKVSLSSFEWKAYTALLKADAPQMYRFTRSAPFLDPIWFIASFRSDDANNPTGWKNEDYDRLVDQIASTPSGKKRRELIHRAEKILIQDDAIVVPVYYVYPARLVSKQLHGYKMNPLTAVQFSQIRKTAP